MNNEIDEIVRNGLAAYARLQKNLSRIEQMILSFEVPDQHLIGLMFYQKNKSIVNGYLVDAAFDNATVRDAMLRLESITRSGSVVYREAYQTMLEVYRQGERDALRRLYDSLNTDAKEALRLESIGMAAMTDAERAALRERILRTMEQA